VEIADKRPSENRSDGCTVSLTVSFANADIETRADAQLDYVRQDDGFTCTAATVGAASHRALRAVSEQAVLGNIGELLQAAEPDDGRTSLSRIYRDAQVEVSSSDFDDVAQTCSYVLHLESAGAFVAYECDLTAHFRFAAASGAWELADATVSEGAKDLGLHPLVGTWQGNFASQESASGRCLAARDAGLVVKVSEATPTENGATIAGTVSGVAHLHEPLEADADASEGDLTMEDIPFSGTLSTGDVELDVIALLAGNQPKREDAGLVFNCVTQDVTGGTVALTLTFGMASAPDAATATLTCTHPYQDTILLLLPVQSEARWVDHFTLEKVG
jgi:hypothetical protein